ncbi:MAG: GNAT family N-acetyltransferase [Cyclobacteriaceae bacterium]
MIEVRKAQPSDAKYIVKFQLGLAKETEDIDLDKETVQKGVDQVFSDESKGQYFVAELEGEVVGSLLTTYEWSDWRNGTTLWIQSVFVHKKHRWHGVYKKLYHHVKQMVAEDPNYTGIRLYVYKDNQRAKAAYSNLGMHGDSYEIFEWMKE